MLHILCSQRIYNTKSEPYSNLGIWGDYMAVWVYQLLTKVPFCWDMLIMGEDMYEDSMYMRNICTFPSIFLWTRINSEKKNLIFKKWQE